MDKINWVRELIQTEQQLEEKGLIDIGLSSDPQKMLSHESIQFLLQVKTEIVDALTAFNELKSSPVGKVKIFGVAKTYADFMIFRNGFKMLFTLKTPGQILVKMNFISTSPVPQPGSNVRGAAEAPKTLDEYLVEAKWGAFGEVIWTYRGLPVKIEAMTKYLISVFIRESSR
ncbi:MAG: hypothetical protein V4736_05190 [Bdellovibrionota bacterium]